MLRDADDDVDNNKEEQQRKQSAWAGGEQPVQAKGEEVNLLVSAQIKMLLNANEARQWGEPAAVQLTGIGWQSSLINPTTDYTTTPLPFLPYPLLRSALLNYGSYSCPSVSSARGYFPCAGPISILF